MAFSHKFWSTIEVIFEVEILHEAVAKRKKKNFATHIIDKKRSPIETECCMLSHNFRLADKENMGFAKTEHYGILLITVIIRRRH